jgi:ABC-2 type transport system permease protein
MKTLVRIARLELSALFYSPVAWLALIIFIIQSGIDFTTNLQTWAKYQEMQEKLGIITTQVYANPIWGIFSLVQGNLYLYIPLLTMGLVSREINSGSIKLLLSSPVTVREIVFGKYLAMMAYGLVLLSVLIACGAAGEFFIRSVDIKLILSGLLGLYLLICAYSAIGLFMSCLTSYQVVAAITTFVVFAILGYIGDVGQNIDFVRDITYFLSISGRSAQLIGGLISTKDVCYFLIVIALFLGLSILKLRSGRESLSPMLKASRYVGWVASMLLLGYLTSRPGLTGYYDMTATKIRTLTPNSQHIVRNMDLPLKIHTYVNMLDQNYYVGLPERRNEDLTFFEQYQRFLPGLKIDYIYYYDTSKNDRLFKNNPNGSLRDLAQRTAHSVDFDLRRLQTPAEMQARVDLAPEEHRYVRQLEYGDDHSPGGSKKTFLRMFDDPMRTPGETEITAALKRLIVTPPRIAFLTGNNQRSMDKAGDRDYKMAAREVTFRYSLINQGFDVNDLSVAGSSIPKDITAVVIADPKTPFNPDELDKLNQYLAGGGNMLVAGEPGKQDILNPFLRSFGVQMTAGTMMQESKDFAPDFVRATFSPGAGACAAAYETLRKDHLSVAMSGTAGLTYDGNTTYAMRPILVTDDRNTWNRPGGAGPDTGKLVYTPLLGDDKRQATLALALTRKVGAKQQKIMVIGDADFMSNAELARRNVKTANFPFIVELFKWFSDGEFPIDTKRPEPPDYKLLINRDGIHLLKIALLGVIPAILLIVASILLIRRIRN